MNWIRALRDQTGVTQKTLAVRAKTSQPTIALYESGAKSPTLVTLERLALSLELDLSIAFVPSLTREDLRSLAYHRSIARMLRSNPGSTVKKARQNLRRMAKQHSAVRSLFERWGSWLNLPTEDLISKILDPGLMARDMRQVTPFAGVLSPSQRAKILSQFRKQYTP